MMQVAQKPSAPGSLRKDKDREKQREGLNRDRKEQFNEDKLNRGGASNRRRGGNSLAPVVKKPEGPSKVSVDGPMSVGDFAKLIRREPSEIIKKLLFLGIMATINQDIDTDAMELIAGEYTIELTVVEPVDEEAVDMMIVEENPEAMITRPPVVTIMGHVDHGKTTLLDAIRESKVTTTESGGITQHIGAYQVTVNNRPITFLDTPGHEAFTTMRARGAQVTDVTILVVAADDGVMPQTVEALNHAKAANVPIIVAVNKMDKPGANPDRVKQELTQYGLVAEEWGGETVFAPISALKREGLDELLEMVLLVTDIKDLKANPVGRPRGTVIEAKLDKGRGPLATVLVQNGTLRVGDILVAGTTSGRVRAMLDDMGQRIKEAPPSTPVEIQGLSEVPSAGDLFVVYDDEKKARNLVQKRSNRERAEQYSATSRVTLDDLYRQIKEGSMKDLNVIVKADVQGSVEAIVQSISKIDVEGVRVRVIHRGAGAITESDVSLASASNAIIIGFHVRPDVNAKRAADAEKVDIRQYSVIYKVMEELESAMKGMLDPEYKEVVLGHAEVRQTFSISKVGTIAGCYVTDGKITRDSETRIIRDGVVVFEGSLDTLKRFKDDVREVATGYECGITIEKFNDIKVGDVVEAYKMEAIKVQ
jgi:translation initiation factor IF-2